MDKYINTHLFYNYNSAPPEDIVTSVNPCRKAMLFILAGFALTTIKLNFLYLNYTLPLVGLLLSFMGFRTLKSENKWFLSCFVITLFQLLEFSFTLALNTTVFHSEIYQSVPMQVLSHFNALISLFLFFSFGKGIKHVQIKSNIPESAGGTTALIVWYTILYALALIGYSGIIISIIMIIAFVFIIIALYELSNELNDAGYILSPAQIKVPNWLICTALCVSIVSCSIAGYTFCGKYSMDWQITDSTSASCQEIKLQLRSLGYPEYELNDLSENELLQCKGALFVKSESKLHPVNSGREVTNVTMLNGRKTIIHSTVFDQKELRLTSVAVLLPTAQPSWKVFHHFTWEITPQFYGTECIRIIPAYNFNTAQGWISTGEISGRILYDNNAATYTAPYESLGTFIHTADDMFFGANNSEDIYGAFSFPNQGTNHRGYVSYTTSENQPGWMFSSWIDYTHQKSILYPNQTALEENFKSILSKSDSFISAQDAIQFRPNK